MYSSFLLASFVWYHMSEAKYVYTWMWPREERGTASNSDRINIHGGGEVKVGKSKNYDVKRVD